MLNTLLFRCRFVATWVVLGWCLGGACGQQGTVSFSRTLPAKSRKMLPQPWVTIFKAGTGCELFTTEA